MAHRHSDIGPASLEDHAMPSRRRFIELTSAAAVGALTAGTASAQRALEFDPRLLPSADEVWGWFEAVSQYGPKPTGNAANRKFVDWLESGMQEARLSTARDAYTFPRWEAKRWALKATPKGGSPLDLPVTNYYPHSGRTGPAGVTGALVYGGRFVSARDAGAPALSKPNLPSDLKGKIVFIEYEITPRDYSEWYQPWGFYTPDTTLEKYVSSVMAQPFEQLEPYEKAGAAGVIIGWTNLSDGQATGQHWPFGRPVQEMPALLVGRTAGAQLRQMAAEGATATLTLEADVFPDTKTDTVYGTLPGTSDDEALIIYTHHDGPNMVQENAGIGLVALAKYFSKIPQGSRNRTIVFVIVAGHDTGAYVPGIRGFIERHPDVIKKTVGAVTAEHLGCRSWRDDPSMQYVPTGKDETTFAITNHEPLAKIVLESLPGTAERHAAVVKPTAKGRYLGLGSAMAALGLPTLGYYASPTYLNLKADDGCMSKLSKPLLYGQLQAIAKIIHRMDVTSAADLKGPSGSARG